MAEILSEFGHLVGLAGGNNIQATTMPTYSSVPLGTIVQYIGTTTADYINGYFYKATATGWEQHDTQPASNADNSITAFKESSPALAAHAVDEYIRYNNVTYIVTAAIAIGDNLVIGTNIAVPTLDEGTVIYTPETGSGINGVVDVLVDGQSVVDENGEAHINTPNAGGIGYDNTTSELEATNTQDAIDEVVDIVADKVDKVSSATNGNLAGLDASGNLTDSGVAANNVVNKSGDTMTGDLAINKASADLAIRASGSKFSHIKSSATGGDRTNYLPNKDGTFAMTSDVDNKVGNYVQLPYVSWQDLPSQSTDNETYFRELIPYYNTNGYLNFSAPTHVQAICNPNLQGILEGFIYNGNISLQYSWWCATVGRTQIFFGYDNSNWYFYNVKGAISQTQMLYLNDTITINNLEYNKAYLVTWQPQYTSNTNGAWIVQLGRHQQHVIKLSELNVSLSYTLTSITLTYLSANNDTGTLTVTPI